MASYHYTNGYSISCVNALISVFVSFFFVPQWMLESGFIRQLCSGVYHLLPLAYRVLDNIVSLVEHEMTGVGVARIVVPILTPSALCKRSGEAT